MCMRVLRRTLRAGSRVAFPGTLFNFLRHADRNGYANDMILRMMRSHRWDEDTALMIHMMLVCVYVCAGGERVPAMIHDWHK